MEKIKDWRMWALVFAALGGVTGLLAAGYFIGQWGISAERFNWKIERAAYIARYPVVRKQERESCTREYEAQLAGVRSLSKQQTDDMADMKKQMQTTNDLAAYTLRFLGDRAKVADQHSAAVLKQTKEATAAAVDAVHKIVPLEQKVNAAVMKSDEAVVNTKALDKKLETATRPRASGQAMDRRPPVAHKRYQHANHYRGSSRRPEYLRLHGHDCRVRGHEHVANYPK